MSGDIGFGRTQERPSPSLANEVCEAFGRADWMPIRTAPRNGLTVLVCDPDCGVFAMGWMADAENPLVGDVRGLWEAPDRSLTWSEHDGFGPTLWQHMQEGVAITPDDTREATKGVSPDATEPKSSSQDTK